MHPDPLEVARVRDHKFWGLRIPRSPVTQVLDPPLHPAAYDELRGGQFAMQQSAQSAFAQVPVDQAVQQTFNGDFKGIEGRHQNFQ